MKEHAMFMTPMMFTCQFCGIKKELEVFDDCVAEAKHLTNDFSCGCHKEEVK